MSLAVLGLGIALNSAEASVLTVPEPATGLLLLVALGVGGLLGKRLL
jgi:hypothetical protein